MKALPVELTTEIAKEYYAQAHLYRISLSTTHRFTDADIDIFHNGVWWYSKGIEFDAARFSASPKVDNISVEIDNVDLNFSSIVLSEEVRGKEFAIYRVALDKNISVIGGPALLFLGYIDSAEIDHQRARFDVYNHFIRWRMLTPKHVHPATCRWTFRSVYCGYTGSATWCDHSWERCVALNNTLNFGGFRWCPYLVDKQIWWGSVPK